MLCKCGSHSSVNFFFASSQIDSKLYLISLPNLPKSFNIDLSRQIFTFDFYTPLFPEHTSQNSLGKSKKPNIKLEENIGSEN